MPLRILTYLFANGNCPGQSTRPPIYDQLVAGAPDCRFKALALSSAICHAGDWLNVIPSQSLGLHLYDRELRLCLQYWLGLPMVDEEVRCPICQAVADPLGDHQVGCGGSGDRIFRHDSTGRLIFSCKVCSLSAQERSASLIPGSKSCPTDLYLQQWSRGQPAALDVTVISTMQASQ